MPFTFGHNVPCISSSAPQERAIQSISNKVYQNYEQTAKIYLQIGSNKDSLPRFLWIDCRIFQKHALFFLFWNVIKLLCFEVMILGGPVTN